MLFTQQRVFGELGGQGDVVYNLIIPVHTDVAAQVGMIPVCIDRPHKVVAGVLVGKEKAHIVPDDLEVGGIGIVRVGVGLRDGVLVQGMLDPLGVRPVGGVIKAGLEAGGIRGRFAAFIVPHLDRPIVGGLG